MTVEYVVNFRLFFFNIKAKLDKIISKSFARSGNCLTQNNKRSNEDHFTKTETIFSSKQIT